MSDAQRIAELEAEIARLRAVCEDYDIDPDAVPLSAGGIMVSPAEIIRQTIRARAPQLIESCMRHNALLQLLTKERG